MRVEYREEPCRTAVTKVSGMPFGWSLNPYTGCAHQCTFCYVRGFELRAGRPSDDRYGASVRVKTNLVERLRVDLARRSWNREQVAIGTATDPYQPAEGRYRLTRGCLEALAAARNPFSLITRDFFCFVLMQLVRRPAADLHRTQPARGVEITACLVAVHAAREIGEDDDRKLQTLGFVHGHQPHAVAALFEDGRFGRLRR